MLDLGEKPCRWCTVLVLDVLCRSTHIQHYDLRSCAYSTGPNMLQLAMVDKLVLLNVSVPGDLQEMQALVRMKIKDAQLIAMQSTRAAVSRSAAIFNV